MIEKKTLKNNKMEKQLFNIEPFIQQLNEKQKILEWLIKGSGIHCLPIRYVSGLTKERIVELYNVKLDYFENKTNEKETNTY